MQPAKNAAVLWEAKIKLRLNHPLLPQQVMAKLKKEFKARVNLCYEIRDEKKCVTLSKEEAYATKKWVEDNDGVLFWTQVLPD